MSKLSTIVSMIEEFYGRNPPMLVSTDKLLRGIMEVALDSSEAIVPSDEELKSNIAECAIFKIGPNDKVTLSCDASIKENPGGPSSVGVVIRNEKGGTLELSNPSRATTNNQAEYDAVYFGLTSLMNLRNNPGCQVEVRSDSKLVIEKLKGNMKCNDKKLRHKRNAILDLVAELPVPVNFEWRPRNSTPDLELANYLAQDLIQVPRH